jgi:hypothetical protein
MNYQFDESLHLLDEAEQRLDQLSIAIAEWMGESDFKNEERVDHTANECILVVRMPEVPLQISSICNSVVDNLRPSLDYAIFALSSRNLGFKKEAPPVSNCTKFGRFREGRSKTLHIPFAKCSRIYSLTASR